MIQSIEAIICSHTGENIPPEILHSKSQEQHIKTARQIIWHFARREGMTLQKIGKHYGKGHANVLSGIRYVNNLVDTEPEFAKKIDDYQRRINLHKEIFSRISLSKLLLSDLDIKIKECESELVSMKSRYAELKRDIDLINCTK